MLRHIEAHTVTVAKAAAMTEAELADKIIIGEHYVAQLPEYTEEYDRLIAECQEGGAR